MSGALSGSRPNIVLVVLDRSGARTGAPRIDEIGRGGMAFRQAYADAPLRTPSPAALLTGRYAQHLGLLDCENPLAEALRAAGYRTGIFRERTEAAIDFLRASADRRPFFAHLPHSAVGEADRQVGRILYELRALGLEESTLVIVTGDHGPRSDGGGDLFESGIRVPFAARWPGRVPIAENRYPVSLVDLLPTLSDLAGAAAAPDRSLHGISLAPALAGERMPPGRTLYVFDDVDGCAVAALRQDQWKMVWPATVWPELGREALFNLDRDPGESTDVAAAHPLIRDALAERARIFTDEVQRTRTAAAERARHRG